MEKSEEGWWRFIDRLLQLKDKEEVNDYLELFLTHEERQESSAAMNAWSEGPVW